MTRVSRNDKSVKETKKTKAIFFLQECQGDKMTHSQENTVKRGTRGVSRVNVTHTNRGNGKKTRQEQCQGDKMTNGTQRKEGRGEKKQVYNNTKVSGGGGSRTHTQRVDRDRRQDKKSIKGTRGQEDKSGEGQKAGVQECQGDQRTQIQERRGNGRNRTS